MWAAPPRSLLLCVIALLAIAAAGCSPAPSTDVAGNRTQATVGRPGPLATATAPPTPATPSASPSAQQPPESLAKAALDTYLDGFASQTFGRAMAVSEGAARRIALIRLVLAEHNRARGATTTVAVSDRTFTPARLEPGRVSFAGRAVIRSTVGGEDGGEPEASVRELTDPVVERRGSRWLLTAFVWGGHPIVAHDGTGTVWHGGVELRVEGSVAFGDVLGVVVLLYADGAHSVRIEADHLRIDDAEAVSNFYTLIDGQPGLLYLTYPRRDARPVSWRVSIAVDDRPETHLVLDF